MIRSTIAGAAGFILTASLIAQLAAAPPAAAPKTATAPTETGPAATKIAWQTDLMEAHRISVKEQRPMLIVFGAEWCKFCHKLDKEIAADPSLVKYVNEEFVPVHLDFDKNPKIAEILEVESLPTSVVLSPKSDLLGTVVGYVKTAEYRKSLGETLETGRKLSQTAAAERPTTR